MDSQRGNRIRSRLPGRGSLADGDRGPTGVGDRTSRFQAASYPVLMVFQTLSSISVLRIYVANDQRRATKFRNSFFLVGATQAAIRPNKHHRTGNDRIACSYSPETSAIPTPCSKRNRLGLTEADQLRPRGPQA